MDNNVARKFDEVTRIHTFQAFRPGQHILLRNAFWDHHALVLEVHGARQSVKVGHYGNQDFDGANRGTAAEDFWYWNAVKASLSNQPVYEIKSTGSFPVEEMIGNFYRDLRNGFPQRYCPRSFNCEHAVNLWLSGVPRSEQADDFVIILLESFIEDFVVVKETPQVSSLPIERRATVLAVFETALKILEKYCIKNRLSVPRVVCDVLKSNENHGDFQLTMATALDALHSTASAKHVKAVLVDTVKYLWLGRSAKASLQTAFESFQEDFDSVNREFEEKKEISGSDWINEKLEERRQKSLAKSAASNVAGVIGGAVGSWFFGRTVGGTTGRTVAKEWVSSWFE